MEQSTDVHMKLLADKLAKVQQLQQAQNIYSCDCRQDEENSANSLPSSPFERDYHGVRLSGSNLHSQASLIK